MKVLPTSQQCCKDEYTEGFKMFGCYSERTEDMNET